MGISPARAEAAAKAMATIEHARRKLTFIRQILRCANRTVLTCWTAVDYTPPNNWQASVGVRQILRGATQAAGHQRRVRNRSPGGVAESQPNDHRSIGSQRRSFGKRLNIPATNRREACGRARFVHEGDPGREVFQNQEQGTGHRRRACVTQRDVLEVQLQARIVNDLAAGNRDCFRNISTACTDGESGKNRAAAVRALTLVSRIGNRYAGQHLAGKGRRQDVFLAVQALAQPVIPDLDRGGVIDRVCIAVVVVIAYIHVPHQRLCSSRAVTAIESDKQIGLRTGMAPHRVEQGENRSDARHADWNSEANGARSKICRCGALPIIVGAGRNRERDASEILVAGWIRASVYDASAVRPRKCPGLVHQAADIDGNLAGARRGGGGKCNGYDRACEAEIGFHSTNPPMCESHGFDVLDCCRLYPPSNWQASVGVRQILRGATQAAGHQRRVRNRSPGGIAESQPNDHRSIGSQRRSFGKRLNIPATNRREACGRPRFVHEGDPGGEVFQNQEQGTCHGPRACVTQIDVLGVQFQARMVNDGAAGNRDCFRNISTARANGEGGKNRAAEALIARICDGHAGQHLAGKGRGRMYSWRSRRWPSPLVRTWVVGLLLMVFWYPSLLKSRTFTPPTSGCVTVAPLLPLKVLKVINR